MISRIFHGTASEVISMDRIDTVAGRTRLAPRDEPYFARQAKGRFVGFRKRVSGASWTARYHPDEGKPISKTLAEHSEEFSYDQATEAARAWFKDLDEGVTGKALDGKAATVAVACHRYVEDRRREKSEACAHDNQKRFERTVYGNKRHSVNAIAAVKLSKFRAHHFKTWRNGLTGSKSSVNRNVTALRAALMRAVKDKLAPAHIAVEMAGVQQHKNAGSRRTLYLDRLQRRKLINACTGGLRNLIEAATLTGARAGELTSARVGSFDARQKTLNVTGKTGSRAVLLSPSAVSLFSRLCEGREPGDFILTRDDGRRWSHSDWDELVREAAKLAELPGSTVLYTLRHSWITQALMDGLSTLEVARITGTSLVMIEKHYGHLVTGSASERLAKIEMA
jgi:integrase